MESDRGTGGDRLPDDGLPQDASGLTSYYVGRAREGDRESLEWVVERLTPLLMSQARYRLGKRLRELYDPEDLVNDVWLATIPKLPDLSDRDGRYTPVLLRYLSQTLIYRINNLIEKHIRGKPAKARSAPRADETSGGDPVDGLSADVTGCVTRLVRKEHTDVVSVALEKVPEKDREIIVLRGIEQRPYKEIEPILGRDPKILAVQYQRALEKLRRELPGSVFEELATD